MSKRFLPIFPLRIILFVVCFASGLSFAGCGTSNPPPSGPPVVTKSEADGIKVGMTLEEAQKIVGNPGETRKVAGNDANTATAPVPHVWKNPDNSLLAVTLQDGKIRDVQPINLK